MAKPDEAVVTVLDTIVTLTSGTNLFAGPVRPSPDEAVFALCTGGYAPVDYMSATLPLKTPTVQVTVRSDVDEFGDGESLAYSCWGALHKATPPTGYLSVTCVQSDPIYLGQDESRRHLWTINVELRTSSAYD